RYPSPIKGPRRDRVSNVSAGFHPAYAADRHFGFRPNAYGFEPLARGVYVSLYRPFASGYRDNDAVLSAFRQTVPHRPTAGVRRRRTLSKTFAGDGAGGLPAMRNNVRR